jgi:cell division protease FtsH
MFTERAQAAIDLAKEIAVRRTAGSGAAALEPGDLAAALSAGIPSADWLAELLSVDVQTLRQRYRLPMRRQRCEATLPMSAPFRRMLAEAKRFAEQIPLVEAHGVIGQSHLVAALAAALCDQAPSDPPKQLRQWVGIENQSGLAALDRRIRILRHELLTQVYGQDHAVHAFVEALFGIELVAAADHDRAKPPGLFVFAGPPGVGKTYLAELAAKSLERPFMRFDMSGFAQSYEVGPLVGTPPAYRGAQPGLLTQFVKDNPTAILLFDEIEKAHASAIHLFLQLLDAGRLQDRHTEETIAFRDCIVIFTTNAGRRLYETEGSTGVSLAHRDYHRTTILDALRGEIDPQTKAPFFPEAICSRMGTGHPILFRHLALPELVRVAGSELTRVASMLAQTYGQRFEFTDDIPTALVLREGGQADARVVKSRAERFLKEELFRVCGLVHESRLAATFADLQRISVELDAEMAEPLADELFKPETRPSVLLVATAGLETFLHNQITDIDWHVARSSLDAEAQLERYQPDLVLLDLTIPEQSYSLLGGVTQVDEPVRGKTELGFDHAPLTARTFAAGQRFLSRLRQRLPDLPVYLFTVREMGDEGGPRMDEEMLLACMRAGGARGHHQLSFAEIRGVTDDERIESAYQKFGEAVRLTTRQVRMEATGTKLGARRQALEFDIAPAMDAPAKTLRLRCRNFRLVQALRGDDTTAVLADVERPTLNLNDVFGAAAAKTALGFIRDWLREPKRYSMLGVAAPRGVLLTGPPGTGKTLLARALAGESECAFMSVAATSFVTAWQGSGPENIRDLFARARRYAPSIVFIDEIDAIGRRRSSHAGAGHGEEMALNALLTELDGFSRMGDRPVIVIAATNLPELLDPALLRRFARVIDVELPTRTERKQYLEAMLKRRPDTKVSAELIERLSAQGQGMSIRDLERILAEAAVMAIANDGVVDDSILSEAFEKIRFGEKKAGSDTLRTARHEAGHALVMSLTGQPPIYVTTVGRGAFGGYAAFEDRDERASSTLPELEDLLCQLLAGHQAERLFYGERDGFSTGPSSDLERATAIATAMVCDYGMAPEIGFVRIEKIAPAGSLPQAYQASVIRLLQEQGARAASLLRAHETTLGKIVETLSVEGRMTREELLGLLTPEEGDLARGGSA